MDSNATDEILTLSEIATYLKVSEKTILRMVQAGDIPGAKISNQWRFMRDIIEDWLTERMLTASKDDLIRVINTGKTIYPLSKLVARERILIDIKPGSREDVLNQLVLPLVRENIITDSTAFVADLIERENVISTAIARNVAIPHAQDFAAINMKTPSLVLGICRDGTDFNALDGELTHIFILPCTPSHTTHLRLMAKISLLLRNKNIVEKMLKVATVDEIHELLIKTDIEIITHL